MLPASPLNVDQVDDVSRIRSKAAECQSAVVPGRGLLGLEAAYAFTELDLNVDVPSMEAPSMDWPGRASRWLTRWWTVSAELKPFSPEAMRVLA